MSLSENQHWVVLFGRYLLDIAINNQIALASFFDSYIVDVPIDNCPSHIYVNKTLNENSFTKKNSWTLLDSVDNLHCVSYTNEHMRSFLLRYKEGIVHADVNEYVLPEVKIALQYSSMIALSSYCIGLHGVTVLCKDQAIVISAPSGTGKTTLANLLKRVTDSVIVNGDFALLSVDNGNVIFEPTPFCGSSKRCLNYRLRISRIVFIEQALENKWEELGGRDRLIQLMNNTFVPEWDSDIASCIHHNASIIGSSIPFSRFSFAPTAEAAMMFYQMVTK